MSAEPLPAIRHASCRCGQLRATCTGEPVRVSVCHCLDCQRRSGSAFAAQARWPAAAVRVEGDRRTWTPIGDGGGAATFSFCPDCGSTVCYTAAFMPDHIAVAIGAFADPHFPGPTVSVYETRKHAWVAIEGDAVEHD